MMQATDHNDMQVHAVIDAIHVQAVTHDTQPVSTTTEPVTVDTKPSIDDIHAPVQLVADEIEPVIDDLNTPVQLVADEIKPVTCDTQPGGMQPVTNHVEEGSEQVDIAIIHTDVPDDYNDPGRRSTRTYGGRLVFVEDGRRASKVSFSQDIEEIPDDLANNIDQHDLTVAATLVADAKCGRDINFRMDEQSVRSYQWYNNPILRWGLYLAIFLNLFCALFETPAVYSLPYWATIIMELLCHSFYLVRFFHQKSFISSRRFWRDRKHIVVIVVISLTLADILGYLIWINVAPLTHPVRWSRPLRPLYIINFAEGRQIRRAFRNIRRTLPDILNVLVLFFFSVLLFALLALKLFDKRNLKYPNGAEYFDNYWDSIWDLYVLVTTANDPDVMMPAYDNSNWFALFFIIYVIICLYIFMSILLAVIYNNYKRHLKNEVKNAVIAKRLKLHQAFDHLKVYKNGRPVLTQERWSALMKLVVPKKSQTQIDLLMHVLDEKGDNCVEKREFLTAADLLNVELTEIKDRMTYLELYLPRMYRSGPSRVLRMCVMHRAFRYFFDFTIVVNALFIGLDLDQAEWFFLVLFTMEILLKMYTFGPYRFFQLFWNIFDFLVIGAALIATIVEAIISKTGEQNLTLDILLVLRVLRLIKIMGSINRFKIIITTIVNIGPSMLTYGGVIFVFYYVFAIIGMEIFGGLIHYHGNNVTALNETQLFCGNTLLKNTEFYRERYCSNNFNDILKSFVLLFELTVVNQWHVLTSGFVIVTHTASRVYFFGFHLCCVIIILNIFTAFILEAFILEYSLSRGKFEHRIETKIKEMGYGLGFKPEDLNKQDEDKDNILDYEEGAMFSGSSEESLSQIPDEEGPRFHLRKRGRKKVEVLLQYMFEDELGDEIPEESEHYSRRPVSYTLDSIT